MTKDLRQSVGMGGAVAFVTVLATTATWPIYHFVLVPLGLEFLKILVFILVIAALVQLVEFYLRKSAPSLYSAMGIYLPLITTNCAVLGVALFQTAREYDFVQSVTFSAGGGAGFTLALVLMASVRERLQLSDVPSLAQGTALSLMLAGILSLSFMGFAGLGG
jgi:electron transport complex protein RnfA